MISRASYISRRRELMQRVDDGVIVLLGNELTPFNYKNNAYPFRQDSTFRYYFGANKPSLAGVIDVEQGVSTLFGDNLTLDDIIWSGSHPSVEDMAAEFGVEQSGSMEQLTRCVEDVLSHGRRVHILPPYRAQTQLKLSGLLGVEPSQIFDYKSIELLFAVASMRERKSEEEVAAIEDAIKIGYQMHTTAMRMCREGVSERAIAGALQGVASSLGAGVSFNSICSQDGQILHNISQDGVLQSGRMFLCDAGAENIYGYCSDHTRSYPVGGRFSEVQRDIYNIVLGAHDHVASIAQPMHYMELHREAQRSLAEGLKGVGLVSGSVEDIVESGAITLFMPHGLGHGLGMDVHDCENIGERSFDLSEFAEQAAQSGTSIYRASWQLREGTVMTNEPGIYFIPALIETRRGEGAYKGIVNYAMLEQFYNFGGIRIEDDLLITADGGRVLGEDTIPLSVTDIEEFML